MKLGHLLVSLAAIVPRGLCSSPSPPNGGDSTTIVHRNVAFMDSALSDRDATTDARQTARALRRSGGAPLPSGAISPANIGLRGETSSISPPLSWSGSKDLVARVDVFQTKTQLALKILGKTSLIGIGGVAFWGLVGDCKELSNDPNAQSGVKCVVGSIGTAISVVTYYKTISKFFIEFAKDLKLDVIVYASDYAYNVYTGGRLGFGPFARPAAGVTPGKRDGGMLKRAEEHLSLAFGVDVRHIGIWDGTMPGDWQPEEAKREESELIPVFGLNFAGQDVHLAYLGQDAENNGVFKIGHGPGPATDDNKLRLKARDLIPLYNNYYFDQGGLDVVGDSDIDGGFNQADIFPDPSSNQYDWAWVYDELECYMGTANDRHTDQMDSIGLWFQIYDGESFGTLSAGAIAPFYGTTQSIIQWMRPEGGLETSAQCTT